jgi:OHCU decarboxylase
MLLEIDGLSKSFGKGRHVLRALDDVHLSVGQGQAVGLVGESGSGKSTLIRCILRLTRPDSGVVNYDGVNVHAASGDNLRRFRREVQLVFQDPYVSLNPRMTVEQLVGEGVLVHKLERTAVKRRARVVEMLELVGLSASDLARYPRSFSGGQRQRIAIARALVIEPRVLVCDEPVSSLDVSVQAQVINLLQDMQRRLNLSILFVAHDLALVRHLCPYVHVLNKGVVVERGTRDTVFGSPLDPYTQSLLAAATVPDPTVSRRRRSDNVSSGLDQRPQEGSERGLEWLNALDATSLSEELLSCCPSTFWISDIVNGRPYGDVPALLKAAKDALDRLDDTDFASLVSLHARIGEKAARSDREAMWSNREQSDVLGASETDLSDLAELNRRYEATFQLRFIVFATGLSRTEIAERMLVRLKNDRRTELRIARAELTRIYALRLERLIGKD